MLCAQVTAINKTAPGRSSVKRGSLKQSGRIKGEKAAVIQHSSCGGVHPRDFILSPDENFLLAANRFAGGIVSIGRDRTSGLLKGLLDSVPMPEGVSLTFRNNTQQH